MGRAIGLAILGVALYAAPSASALVTLGSDLSNPPQATAGCGGGTGMPCVLVQTEIPGRTLASPIDGLVTRFRHRGGSGTIRVRTLRQEADGTFTFLTTTPALDVRPEVELFSAPVRVPIRTGELIGFEGDPDALAPYRVTDGTSGVYFEPAPADGTRVAPFATISGGELIVNADVEADADGDGFGDDTQDGCPTDPTTQDPCSDPEAGRSVNVEPVEGAVLVREPGTNQFLELQAGQQVPVGSIVDVIQGQIMLVAAATRSGRAQQTGVFSGGRFALTQAIDRTQDAITQLTLLGGATNRCPRTGPGPRADQRRLDGRRVDKGFRTRGRYATATSRRRSGWTTTDRCDGTLINVRQGTVDVRDLVLKKTVRVTAGRRYFARRSNR